MHYEKISDFLSLHEAMRRSLCGKRMKTEAAQFNLNASIELARLADELQQGTYQPEKHYCFTLTRPKTRTIYAPPYRDRVVLRSLCDNALADIIGATLIEANAACQKGKGSHFTLDLFESFIADIRDTHGRDFYALKCDIRQFFPSIPHRQLKEKLLLAFHEYGVDDERFVRLCFQFIDYFHTPGTPQRGLALGNQSSQWYGLLYLDSVDKLVTQELGIPHYIRYMDDFIVLHESKAHLQEVKARITEHVEDDLGLFLNSKTQITHMKNGVEAIGWRYIIDKKTGYIVRKIRNSTRTRMVRYVRKLSKNMGNDPIKRAELDTIVNSYLAHLYHGNTYRLREKLLELHTPPNPYQPSRPLRGAALERYRAQQDLKNALNE
ncbi:MAG: RNA-directed DNA polymerase [Coriobacteriia bacterium]|nr:RNA-directed DNA polymerase [Coriobacteriia bacterium]